MEKWDASRQVEHSGYLDTLIRKVTEEQGVVGRWHDSHHPMIRT